MLPTFLIIALTVGAPAPKDKDVAQAIYGLWEIERPPDDASDRAQPRPDGPLRYRFNRDGTWQVFEGNKEIVDRRWFQFDPKPDLPTLDFNTPPTPAASPLVVAIYKIDGDRLTICCAYADDPRPTEFIQMPGSGNYVQRFRRVED
jgi:uncharacterized protein (TIGR03067 family)